MSRVGRKEAVRLRAYLRMATSRLAAGIATTLVLGLTSLPLLGLVATPPPTNCVISPDGSPTILGSALLGASELRSWWTSTGRPQPTALGIGIEELIALYISEGDIEGVRGDLAFAQAVLETGSFTNGDTTRNNFAGIGHYDDAPAGFDFATPATGVRAHIQLLRKYAAGNDVHLARPDVAPRAGAHAETWSGLAGTWATDPAYWTSIESLYATMGEAAPTPDDTTSTLAPICAPSIAAGGYALPVDRHWYDEHPSWFTKPHHDYPAADIPVPIGTPVYAVAGGTVTGTPTSGSCGVGVVVDGNDGASYTYCHGDVGSQTVVVGTDVDAGQRLMLSASTGNSTGPHLHLGVRVGGENRCPQPLLVAIAEGRTIDPSALPASGCIS